MISYTTYSFFLLFFGITFLLYCVTPRRWRWCILLLGSGAFYIVSSKGHIMALLLNATVAWAIGMGIQSFEKTKRIRRECAPEDERRQIKARYCRYQKLLIALGTGMVLSVLLACKYSGFAIGTVNSVFSAKLPSLSLIQPLGVSFFTLESISYMTDVYRGKTKAEHNPLKVLLFLSFLLTVVEGPISRYDQLGTQLSACKQNDLEDISKGVQRVLWGLFKKVVVADRAVILVNAVFENPEKHSGFAVAAGIAFFTLQLYCEFSGIMDVVCGLSRMLGIRLAENFRQPFFAKTIQEFWQRWHISLGAWLRDYVFYPLSLSKGMKKLALHAGAHAGSDYARLLPPLLPLFFVWFCNGFWHGAGWKYIVYGLYYYFLMMLGMLLEPIAKRLRAKCRIDRQSKPYRALQILRTLVIVNIGMLIFKAKDLKTAAAMFRSMVTKIDFSVLIPGYGNGFHLLPYDYAAIAVGVAAMIVVGLLEEKGVDLREKIYRLPYWAKTLIYLAGLFVIIVFGAYGEEYGVVDLIYANF